MVIKKVFVENFWGSLISIYVFLHLLFLGLWKELGNNPAQPTGRVPF